MAAPQAQAQPQKTGKGQKVKKFMKKVGENAAVAATVATAGAAFNALKNRVMGTPPSSGR